MKGNSCETGEKDESLKKGVNVPKCDIHEIILVAYGQTKFIAFDSISCHLHHFYIFGGFFQPFLVFFDVTDLPRKLEFYISDLTISVLVQINLTIQYI